MSMSSTVALQPAWNAAIAQLKNPSGVAILPSSRLSSSSRRWITMSKSTSNPATIATKAGHDNKTNFMGIHSNSLSKSSCTRSVRLQSMGNLTASQVRMADFQSKSKSMKADEMSSFILSVST